MTDQPQPQATTAEAGLAEAGRVPAARFGFLDRLSPAARLAVGLAALDLAIGVVVLFGWIADLPLLTTVFAGLVATKVNAAVSLVLLGVALILRLVSSAEPAAAPTEEAAAAPPSTTRGRLSRRVDQRRARQLAAILAAVVVAIAVATLAEYAFGLNLGIDEALAPDEPAAGTPFPGRVAVPVAIAYLAAAFAMLLLGRRWRGYHLTELLAAVVGAVGGVATLGYAYGAQGLIALGSPTRISLLGAIGLLALAAALIAADPRHGLVGLLTDSGPSGQVARRILPAAVLVVPIGAWIRLEGERLGFYDAEVGLAIMAVFEAVILLVVGAWTATRIMRAEAERSAIRRDRDRFFELSADLVLVTDWSGRMLEVSPSWETILGRSIDEIRSRPFLDFVHPDDRAVTEEIFGEEVLHGIAISGFENRYMRADGTHRWLEWSSKVDMATQRTFAIARDVTDRHRAEEEARDASLYARGLLEASLDPLLTVSVGGLITDVNAAMEAATGRPRGELVGSDFAEHFTEPALARAGHRRVLDEGQVRDYALTIRHRAGPATDVLLNATVFRNQAGEVQGVFAAARDVTDSRRAAQATARLAAIVDSSVDGIFATDRDDTLTEWNDACERIFGYTAAEVRGKQATITSPPRERAEQRRRYEAARKGAPQVYEAFRQRKDGSLFRAQLSMFPMYDQAGTFLGLSTIVRDVTEAYEARERLQAYTNELTRSNAELDRLLKERFALEAERDRREAVLREQAGLLELAHDAIFVRDLESRIRYWNDGAERTYGWTAGEALGRITHELLRTVFPESLQAVDRVLLDTGEWEGQLLHTHHDGRTIVVESRQVVERDDDGRPIAILEINRDVSESVAAHRRLEEYAEELRRSNAELEQFAYVASHDLQEPLRMVTGFVGLLQRRYEAQLGPEADEYIGFAVEGAHRMQDLINDLLTYSRVGTRGGEFEPVDLGEVVEDATLNLRVAIDEAGATVTCGDLPTVSADRHQMLQLLQNLIGNAIKFRGGSGPVVEVGARRHADGWHVYVRDNGIGIAPQHQEQIFVIFRRLHSREAYPGSGIGLAICKKIVERHGGRIWVDSAPGAGATFWFTLPALERNSGGREH